MNPATIGGNARISEWRGVAAAGPLDQSGTLAVPVATTTTVIATVGAMTQSSELVITSDGFKIAGGQTFSRGAGWTGLVTDVGQGYSSDYRLDLPAGVARQTLTTRHASLSAKGVAP